MSGPSRWTSLGSELLHECRVFNLRRLLARSPRTGATVPFFGIEAGDWVNIIPLTPDGDVVMVRQFRHGSGEITLEIPGGMVDAGEPPERAAARELIEETGYRVDEVVPLGGVNPNPALFGNRLHAFLGSGARRVAEIENEGNEETVVELVPLDRARQLVREGGIDHALVVAAFYLLDLRDPAG